MNDTLRKKSFIISFREYLNTADTKYWKIILFILTLVFLTYTQVHNYKTPKFSLKLNTVAKKPIKAPIDFYIDDESGTLLKIEEAKFNSPVAFRMVSDILEEKKKQIHSDFNKLSETKNSDLKEKAKLKELQKILSSYNLTDAEVKELFLDINLQELKQFILIHLERVMIEGIAEDKDWVMKQIEKQGKISRKNILLIRGLKEEEITINQVSTLELALELLNNQTEEQYKDKILIRKFLNRVFEYTLEPNLVIDLKVTSRLEAREVEKVEPEKQLIMQGQTIIRDGDIVRESHIKNITALNQQVRSRNIFIVIIGYGIFNLLLLVVFSYFASKFFRSRFDLNTLILFTTSLFVTVIISNFFLYYEPFKEMNFLTGYSMPAAFFAMLITILITPELALFTLVLLGLYLGSLTNFNFNFLMVAMISSIVGVFATRNIRKRNDLVRAIFYVILAIAVSIISLRIINNQLVFSHELFSGVLGGVISLLLLLFFLPMYEGVLDVCSNLRLLELTDLSNPSLVEMALKAPGTYQHSLTVGTLAEAGAKAIGANTLLARVGAYYHDIGKVNQPGYYIENQKYKRNPHDKISPFMSAKIIISHVKNGVVLAKKEKLPQRVIDIIEQHQGDMVLHHFFIRAQEESRKEKVAETEFKYPGPKPKSAEAVIVMIADKIEAMSKLLTEPTHKNIKEMVMNTFKKLLLDDEQFEDCNILLSDLYKVVNAFIITLDGMYHSRIEYDIDKKKETNGNSNGKKKNKAEANV